jgi:hypothetical protein
VAGAVAADLASDISAPQEFDDESGARCAARMLKEQLVTMQSADRVKAFGGSKRATVPQVQRLRTKPKAERLAMLPRDVQRKAVALIRAPADDSKVGKRGRDAARERSDALERHLRRLRRRKRKS